MIHLLHKPPMKSRAYLFYQIFNKKTVLRKFIFLRTVFLLCWRYNRIFLILSFPTRSDFKMILYDSEINLRINSYSGNAQFNLFSVTLKLEFLLIHSCRCKNRRFKTFFVPIGIAVLIIADIGNGFSLMVCSVCFTIAKCYKQISLFSVICNALCLAFFIRQCYPAGIDSEFLCL